jgi:hypothetical protein
MPGFARALAKTLTEIRLENVPAERLAELGAPGRDLADPGGRQVRRGHHRLRHLHQR